MYPNPRLWWDVNPEKVLALCLEGQMGRHAETFHAIYVRSGSKVKLYRIIATGKKKKKKQGQSNRQKKSRRGTENVTEEKRL